MAEFVLEVIEGPATGTSIPLTNAVELGRNRDLQHSFEDEQMSRRHPTQLRSHEQKRNPTKTVSVEPGPAHRALELIDVKLHK